MGAAATMARACSRVITCPACSGILGSSLRRPRSAAQGDTRSSPSRTAASRTWERTPYAWRIRDGLTVRRRPLRPGIPVVVAAATQVLTVDGLTSASVTPPNVGNTTWSRRDR